MPETMAELPSRQCPSSTGHGYCSLTNSERNGLVQLDPQLLSICVSHGRLEAILPPGLAVMPLNVELPVQAAVAHKGVEGSLDGVHDLLQSEHRSVAVPDAPTPTSDKSMHEHWGQIHLERALVTQVEEQLANASQEQDRGIGKHVARVQDRVQTSSVRSGLMLVAVLAK